MVRISALAHISERALLLRVDMCGFLTRFANGRTGHRAGPQILLQKVLHWGYGPHLNPAAAMYPGKGKITNYG